MSRLAFIIRREWAAIVFLVGRALRTRWARIQAWFRALPTRIEEARHPKRAKKKAFDPEHIPVILPPSMGPLVETSTSDHPMPLAMVPIQSTKADAKRAAHRYAERRAGRPLSWKAARKLLNQWERAERIANAGLAPEYAERMKELSAP